MKDAEPHIISLAAKLERELEQSVADDRGVSEPPAFPAAPSSEAPVKRLGAVLRAKTEQWWTELRPDNDSGAPDASIIIPAFNKIDLTLGCLESLSRHHSAYRFEVIVIDNASSDATSQVLSTLPGIRYVRNTKNRGFVDACNQGAKLARGKTIVFLNNDTYVLNGWLDALLDQLKNPGIGMVGSKLVYPDGSLQEAGGIIFKDGSGHNFGKHKDTNDYEFNYLRDVDYCSGASLAISRRLFLDLGSFDRRYAPAYYEDTDLAMKVRKKGKRVVYEPRSIVAHVEGGTAGTDTGSGFKRFQVINREKFVKKWAKELAKHHYPPGTNPLVAARSGKPKKMLIVDSQVPEHRSDSGSLRMFQLVQAAQKLGYQVTFLPDNLVATPGYTAELQALGVEVVYGKITPRYFYKDRQNMYDVVLLSRPITALWHLDLCKAYQPKAKLIFDTVDLHFLRIGRQAKLEKNAKLAKQAEDWKQIEYFVMDNTDATLVVSDQEQELLKKEKPRVSVHVVSNINPAHQGDHRPLAFSKRSGLLFVGSYNHTPNRDAVGWFTSEILPLVRKTLPDIHVELLGSNPTAKVKKLAGDGISVPGFIEDIDPYFHASRVFICPVRFGAGVKGKVSQALAQGLPVVSTSIGIEGMHLKDGQGCLVADTPKDFAAAIVKLYTDQKLWEAIRKNASATYEQYFSEKAGLEALAKAIRNA